MTPAAAYFCPTCGSASLEASELEGGKARCEACGWHGPRADLLVHAFSHENGSDEDVATAFFYELRSLFGPALALPIARFLSKWGFLSEAQPQLLARYLVAMVHASAVAILEERKKIEHERAAHAP